MSTINNGDTAEGKGFRVVDKRSAPDTEPVASAEQGNTGATPPVPDFAGIVMSFATQALMQLGEMAPPQGMQVAKDVVAAKQTIDILSVLREKTKGNLDKYEDSLFEEVLHNLRLSYVKVKG